MLQACDILAGSANPELETKNPLWALFLVNCKFHLGYAEAQSFHQDQGVCFTITAISFIDYPCILVRRKPETSRTCSSRLVPNLAIKSLGVYLRSEPVYCNDANGTSFRQQYFGHDQRYFITGGATASCLAEESNRRSGCRGRRSKTETPHDELQRFLQGKYHLMRRALNHLSLVFMSTYDSQPDDLLSFRLSVNVF